ncbi:hypothetical protein Hanom_Chr00s110770g01807631 [Helianthus anomalus]
MIYCLLVIVFSERILRLVSICISEFSLEVTLQLTLEAGHLGLVEPQLGRWTTNCLSAGYFHEALCSMNSTGHSPMNIDQLHFFRIYLVIILFR